jgi:VWFA-related protein
MMIISHRISQSRRLIGALLACWSFGIIIHAQQPKPTEGQDPGDVIKIKTELVQTEVMVFDKKGRFVEGLKPEQFELAINGEPRQLSFFDQVTAGSAKEIAQVAAAQVTAPGRSDLSSSRLSNRGRTIFFFLDDLHLSPASLARSREALLKFIADQMSSDDQVAIVSTSGQIGFLQQLTDNPAVLRAAIARLSSRMIADVYTGKTQISDYMASQVFDYGNRELFALLLESTKIEQQMGPGSRHGDHRLAASYTAVPHLRNRLRQINDQARMTAEATLAVLEGLVHSSQALPGRKVVFFLSDGFTINQRKADQDEQLKRIARAAASAGVVIYTMDARGTFMNFGSSVDASMNDYVDMTARASGIAQGEVTATREPLRILADETGGRAVFNSNSIDDGISKAIDETSKYYLLAWRPEAGATEASMKKSLRVTIKDRPDLTVRWRSNYVARNEPVARKGDIEKANAEASSADQMRAAIASMATQKLLPVSLSVGYLNSANTTAVLRISMSVDRGALNLQSDAGKTKSELDVLGLAIDERGQFASMKQLVTVEPKPEPQNQAVVWHQQFTVKPGIYQVRIAVRERSTGRMGSARQWIEIPDAKSRLALSSLFLGERQPTVSQQVSSGPGTLVIDVDHHFAAASILRFQTYVYNAATPAAGPDVWIQARVLKQRQPIMTVAVARVPNNNESGSLPYWSEIPLDRLAPGEYVLEVSATDRVSNQTSSQQARFTVE